MTNSSTNIIISRTTGGDTPLAALAVFGLFALILGVFYFFKNRRKIRRWWARVNRRAFWGYVLAGGLFVLFGGYFIFLDLRY